MIYEGDRTRDQKEGAADRSADPDQAAGVGLGWGRGLAPTCSLLLQSEVDLGGLLRSM